jgi:hypothetical protein
MTRRVYFALEVRIGGLGRWERWLRNKDYEIIKEHCRAFTDAGHQARVARITVTREVVP